MNSKKTKQHSLCPAVGQQLRQHAPLAALTAPLVQMFAQPGFAPQRFPDVPLAGGKKEANVVHAPGKEAKQTVGKTDGYSKNVPGQLDVFSSFSLCCKAPPSFCLLLEGGVLGEINEAFPYSIDAQRWVPRRRSDMAPQP